MMRAMSATSPKVIAIDGPAASGKSTVAKELAHRLKVTFISTGSMYRAVTWWVLESGVTPSDTEGVVELLESTEIRCGQENQIGTVAIGSSEVLGPEQLSATAVNDHVSTVAAIPEVRARLVAEQRRYAQESGIVMEGRDIGSVVFPDTPYKFFITASEEVRQARREAQGIMDKISERDQKDKSRKASPLVIPEDAIVIDTSELGIEQVVQRVLEEIEKIS